MSKSLTSLQRYYLIGFIFLTIACKKEETPQSEGTLQLTSVHIGTLILDLANNASNTGAPVDQSIVVTFTTSLDILSVPGSVTLSSGSTTLPLTFQYLEGNKVISATPNLNLENGKTYTLQITMELKGSAGETFPGILVSFTTVQATLKIISITVADKDLLVSGNVTDIPLNFLAVAKFDRMLDPSTVNSGNVKILKNSASIPIIISLADSDKVINIQSQQPLVHFEKYSFNLSNALKGLDGSVFNGFTKDFYSALDTLPKFPVIPDDQLLTLIEEQTFKYFWDFGHPVSGLARERNTSGDLVTIGGSGFGVMAILVGIQRNFITHQEGIDRLEQIINFLGTADRFHGAWPHWLNGSTGTIIPFSINDNGADLVETAYLIQGLLTVRQFLNPGNIQENQLIEKINDLWESVEWDWFTKGGQDVLYWHWSPDKEWIMNVQIKGYNEALITYLLAAGSPTHPIDATVYHKGWASNGAIINGNSYYGYTLPLGPSFGGPLFFAHYSFLGFNPHNLSDQYANYWEQNVNHSLINRAYCIDNPGMYVGYDESCWGLTASDDPNGYDAHSPTSDNGTISPTAAISSIPYIPDNSLEALKFFYYTIGDKTWGPYGFYDAFNVTAGWWGDSYLAIDQGPIINMIENHRSGMLWDLFVSCPEVTTAMNKLGFTN